MVPNISITNPFRKASYPAIGVQGQPPGTWERRRGNPETEARIRLRKPEVDGSDEIMLALSVEPVEGRKR